MPFRQRSRRLASLALLALLSAASSARAAASQQRSPADSASVDSLRARVERAESAIALLRARLAAEDESAVRTRSRVRLELSGQVLTNAFLTIGRANNVDVPQTVLPPVSPTGGTAGAVPPGDDLLGVTLRQTRVGLAIDVADVLGGTFVGDLDIDFFGGAQAGPADRRLFPEPRLRTSRARLMWPRTELMVGSETPLISDLNPRSLAAVGIPDFSGAGNLWNWLGQLRLTRVLGRTRTLPLEWAVQGALMSPYAGNMAPGEPDAADAGERSERPAVEVRLRARWGEDGHEGGVIGGPGGEIGVGAHRGWVAVSDHRLATSRALSLDARVVPVRGVELRGEAYAGRLLRGLGGGGIGQNFGRTPAGSPTGTVGAPVDDVAGWLQLNVQPHPVVIGGLGCGVDLVDPASVPTRLQNTACAVHAAWRPVQPIVVGAEYRRLGTRYATGTHGVRHYNLALGFEF